MSAEICGACGSHGTLRHFKDEALTIQEPHKVHGLSGLRCAVCDEIYFDADSAKRFSEACDALLAEQRSKEQELFRRVRQKLGLTQKQAAEITGGGVNAFGRYERGEASPVAGVVNLFRLLDRHPELLDELR